MNRSTPLADLTANSLSIQPEIDAAIQRVLDHTSCILSEAVAAFEAEYTRYCEARYCVGGASGTEALCLALLVGGVHPW
jgi:UDP-2-acetamido-2-deoxy-ribo-hexuluronate aminotransferase